MSARISMQTREAFCLQISRRSFENRHDMLQVPDTTITSLGPQVSNPMIYLDGLVASNDNPKVYICLLERYKRLRQPRKWVTVKLCPRKITMKVVHDDHWSNVMRSARLQASITNQAIFLKVIAVTLLKIIFHSFPILISYLKAL